ncbi:MAG: secretin and TonB N-terminal domain-containing protein, partial [Balneolales bacterium]|nr:secretin and TonB N-terminal domain-containing protein [Balneolales bacterium]
MRIKCGYLRISVCFILLPFLSLQAQEAEIVPDSLQQVERLEYIRYLEGIIDSNQVQIELQNLPESVFRQVEDNINVQDIDSRDFLRALGRQYNVNVLVDNRLNRRLTLRLSEVSIIEVLIFVVQEHGLSLNQSGQVFRIREYIPPEPEPEIIEPEIAYENNLLTIDLVEVELSEVTRILTELTGRNIIARNGVSGSITGYLQEVEFENGLAIILNNNGFSLREKDGIYIIDRLGFVEGSEGGAGFWVSMENNLVSLDVVNANISDIIREIGYQSDVNMITYGLPDATITAKVNNLTIDDALTYIFRGTEYTYRKEGDMYIIGDKSTSGIASNKLIRLNHIRSDVVIDMLPASVTQNADVQVVKEQNGLIVIGTNDVIFELENFIKEVDHPTPQILIEALVVDVNTSDMYKLGVSIAQGTAPDSSYLNNPFTMLFGQGADQDGGLFFQGDGTDLNSVISPGGNLLGVRNLGQLPSNFFFQVQALDQEGLVTVRSRPQIATLNGYTASIEIGTTQYFLLESTTPLQSPNQIVTQQSQRFEAIEANVLLEITPWVSASGEVTVEVHPEFNTPVGTLNSETPPTI